MRASDDSPPGFVLVPDFVSVREERSLLRHFAGLEFERVTMRGRCLRRHMLCFGCGFGVNFQSIVPRTSLPKRYWQLRQRAARVAAADAREFTQAIMQRYEAGATIGWHTDASWFGPTIIGLSFGSAATMQFRHAAEQQLRLDVNIPARSLYVLTGASRYLWHHRVAVVKQERISITFRSMASSNVRQF